MASIQSNTKFMTLVFDQQENFNLSDLMEYLQDHHNEHLSFNKLAYDYDFLDFLDENDTQLFVDAQHCFIVPAVYLNEMYLEQESFVFGLHHNIDDDIHNVSTHINTLRNYPYTSSHVVVFLLLSATKEFNYPRLIRQLKMVDAIHVDQ